MKRITLFIITIGFISILHGQDLFFGNEWIPYHCHSI